VSVDVDYYSSAVASLRLFDAPDELFLPHVFCYFDDTVGDDDQVLRSKYVGELHAIAEFNRSHDGPKLAPIHGLRHKRIVPAPWNDGCTLSAASTTPHTIAPLEPRRRELSCTCDSAFRATTLPAEQRRHPAHLPHRSCPAARPQSCVLPRSFLAVARSQVSSAGECGDLSGDVIHLTVDLASDHRSRGVEFAPNCIPLLP
jgi:hypothetical protein